MAYKYSALVSLDKLGMEEPGEDEMEAVLGDVIWGERVSCVRGSVITLYIALRIGVPGTNIQARGIR
jgi:hypothetical protein